MTFFRALEARYATEACIYGQGHQNKRAGGSLDALKIPYETREYPVEDEQFDGLLHRRASWAWTPPWYSRPWCSPATSCRTWCCCLPVERSWTVKAVARVTGNKRVSMLPQKELLGLTGYLRGGCSPIGMKKAFPTFVDASARNQEKISVSAGVRGCQVILATDQLLACVHGTLAELTQAAGE